MSVSLKTTKSNQKESRARQVKRDQGESWGVKGSKGESRGVKWSQEYMLTLMVEYV